LWCFNTVVSTLTLPDAGAANTAILPHPGWAGRPRVALGFVVQTERRPSDHLGGYRIVRLLGRGGSGAVYLVTDEGGAQAALKLVDTANATARLRLAREVAALQSLRHPHVPRVLDAELDDAEAFVVFEFIDGPSLSHMVRSRGALPPEHVAHLAEVLADALETVHAAGVVHRDVTPANVLLGPHGPVLIDFGIAHTQEDDRLTRTGLVSGTAGYVAPEVIDGADPSPASDDWALAATLAFAATGAAPFGTGMGALSATLAGEVRPDVPLALARALTAAPQFRPRPRELARLLAGADETAVLGLDEVAPTLVAPAWDDEDEEFEELEEPAELAERVLPKRRAVLALWGVALVALATVAPLIAGALAIGAAVVARAVESAARAVWRSRERRGVDQGGVVAQAFASPWHVGRALVLTLPSAVLAGGGSFLVAWLASSFYRMSPDFRLWQALALTAAATVAVVLLAWGPRGAEARRGAHLVAAAVAPDREWTLGWALAAMVVMVTCFGISLAGIDPLWWPLGPNGPY